MPAESSLLRGGSRTGSVPAQTVSTRDGHVGMGHLKPSGWLDFLEVTAAGGALLLLGRKKQPGIRRIHKLYVDMLFDVCCSPQRRIKMRSAQTLSPPALPTEVLTTQARCTCGTRHPGQDNKEQLCNCASFSWHEAIHMARS